MSSRKFGTVYTYCTQTGLRSLRTCRKCGKEKWPQCTKLKTENAKFKVVRRLTSADTYVL